jgi:hypothetical protein
MLRSLSVLTIALNSLGFEGSLEATINDKGPLR